MTIEINYPVNGCDLDLLVEGEVYGLTRDEYNYEIYRIVANYKNIEVFRLDDEGERGLLCSTDLSDELVQVAESLLVTEKFDYGNF